MMRRAARLTETASTGPSRRNREAATAIQADIGLRFQVASHQEHELQFMMIGFISKGCRALSQGMQGRGRFQKDRDLVQSQLV